MQPQDYNHDCSEFTPCPIDTCFGCVNGFCTIISGDAENGCFYKDRTEAFRQIRHSFYQLISQERFDLLYRYADTYAELGLMDQEIAAIHQKQAEIDAFRNNDLAKSDVAAWIPPYAEWYGVDGIDDIRALIESLEAHDDTPEDSEADFDNSIDKAEFDESTTESSIAHAVADDSAETAETLDLSKGIDLTAMTGITDTAEAIAANDHVGAASDYLTNHDILVTVEECAPREYHTSDDKNDSEQHENNNTRTTHKCWISDHALHRVLPQSYYSRFPEPRHRKVSLAQRAREYLGASIVYDCYCEYITVMRILWSGDYDDSRLHRLIVRKWECETFFGSRAYWLYTNINPERIMDRACQRAMRECKAAIRRHDLKIKAGMIEE